MGHQWPEFQILWTLVGVGAPTGKKGRTMQWIIDRRDARIVENAQSMVISQGGINSAPICTQTYTRTWKAACSETSCAGLSIPVADGQHVQLCGTVRGFLTVPVQQ